MASKNLLSLSLDEYIQSKRGQNRSQMQNFKWNRKKGLGVRDGRVQRIKFQKNTNINRPLASRLSKGNVGGFRRTGGGMQNRLGVASDSQRTSVHNRLTLNNNVFQSRGLNRQSLQTRRNIKTKGSEDFQPVRITSGAIVKGMRSDQLLLQKINETRNFNVKAKMEALRALQRPQLSERRERERMRSGSSKVLMNIDRGLTVSIANEILKRPKARFRRRLTPPSPPQPPSLPSSSDESVYSLPPTTSRRFETKGAALPAALLRLGQERPPPPKPHRQVLDSQVQKEIATLQGYDEPLKAGPGAGVKNFRMIPSITKHSLNERFTMEKSGE